MGRGESDERDESVVAVARERAREGQRGTSGQGPGRREMQSISLPSRGWEAKGGGGGDERERERERDEEADEDEIGTYLYPRASVFRRAGDTLVQRSLVDRSCSYYYCASDSCVLDDAHRRLLAVISPVASWPAVVVGRALARADPFPDASLASRPGAG